jgi:hypothetical protein
LSLLSLLSLLAALTATLFLLKFVLMIVEHRLRLRLRLQ